MSKNEVQAATRPAPAPLGEPSGVLRPRGEVIDVDNVSSEEIMGYDHELMKARALLSYEEEKKLLRRVDWHLIPWVSLIFLVNRLDVNNVANTRIMNQGTPRNILTQLHMSANDYNFITTIFYIPFICFEIPSNLLLKRMLPSRWQARIMISWGLVVACQAAVTSKAGFYATRFFLGVCQAGMLPGVLLQMSYWYRADEMTLRLLVLYAFENISNIISALLAFGFDAASGKRGLSGWQWFFLVEGILTICFSVVVWFVLPDFPAQAKWLSEKEKAFLQSRLPANSPRASEQNFNFREILQALKDKRLWYFTGLWASYTIAVSGLSFYLPSIIATLHLTNISKSQLLTIPSSILPIFIIAFSSYLTDWVRVPRPVVVIGFMVIMLACYGVLYTYPNVGGVYAAITIAVSISHAWYSVMWPWRLQTTSKATGSAFAIAFSNSLGQIGFAIGPQIFQSKYAPKYTVPFSIAMVFVGVCILGTLWTWWETRSTEKQTRSFKQIRIAAGKEGQTVLDDVDVRADLEKHPHVRVETH